MIPGGRGGMNPRKLNSMMKQLGIDVKDVPDVEEVIVRTRTKEFVLAPAEVSIMTAQGQKTWQVVGEVRERPRGGTQPAGKAAASPSAPPTGSPAATFNDADIELVASQAGVSKDKARAALGKANGEPAAAIVLLLEGKA